MSDFVLKALGTGLSALAVAVAVFTLTRVPSVPPDLLGVRGMRRARKLGEGGLFAACEPAIRWLGVRVRVLMSESLRSRLERHIVVAGDYLGLLPEELAALDILSTLAGGFVAWAYVALLDKGILYVPLGLAIGAVVPYLHLTGTAQERLRHVRRTLPYTIDLIALGLSAGLDFPGALRQVIEKSGDADDPLVEELGLVLRELQVGKTRSEALALFAERVPSESVQEFVGAVTQAEERGNPLTPVLQIQATVSRQRRSSNAETAASRASVQMVGPMVLVFIAIMLLIMSPMAFSLKESLTK